MCFSLKYGRFFAYGCKSGYNIAMRKYESWKGTDGIAKAEAYERELRDTLGREPTKRDFREAGRYNVWIALYRYRRQLSPLHEKKIEARYNQIREGLLKSKRLMKKMIEDVYAALGFSEVDKIVGRIRRKRG
jgi:hypothetical protein